MARVQGATCIMMCFVIILILLELIRPGKDQRDYYYFMALGHYKLEVNSCMAKEIILISVNNNIIVPNNINTCISLL